MVYTSVIIVMPLGTLVAQRIADPAAFSNGELSHGTTRVGNRLHDRFGRFAAAESGTKSNHLLNPTWSESDKESTVFSGRRGSSNVIRGKSSGVTSIVSTGIPSAKSSYQTKMGEPMSAVDIELARIDADLEAGVVRVDREIQQDEEVL